MGAVYVASQEGLERKVALKVRLPSGDARAAVGDEVDEALGLG